MDFLSLIRTRNYKQQKVCVVFQNKNPRSWTVMGLDGKAFLASKTFKDFEDALIYYEWMVDKFKDEKRETTPIGFIGRL